MVGKNFVCERHYELFFSSRGFNSEVEGYFLSDIRKVAVFPNFRDIYLVIYMRLVLIKDSLMFKQRTI